MTKQNKTIVREIAQLLDRRAELLEPREKIEIADRLRSGEPTEIAARNHQRDQAEAVQRELELQAVEDRLEELWADLSGRLKTKRAKALAGAQHYLETARLKWQAGDGARFFSDEQIRAKLFVFSSASDAALEAMNEAVQIPLTAQDFKWEIHRAVRPGRHQLARLQPPERFLIERAQVGQGLDNLPRFLESC